MRAAELTLLFLLAGCVGPIDKGDGGSDGGAAEWPAGSFELGGELPDGGGFTPLAPEMQATPGAQGGFHIPVMYRVTGQTQAGVIFEHKIRRSSDNTLVSRGTRTLDVTPVAAGESWTTPGAVIIFICPTPVGINVVGENLTFEVTATKAGALLGSASASTVFRCPDGNAFCDSICRG